VKSKSEGVEIILSERSSIAVDDGRTAITFCESPSILNGDCSDSIREDDEFDIRDEKRGLGGCSRDLT
jgi:hypothetical protein